MEPLCITPNGERTTTKIKTVLLVVSDKYRMPDGIDSAAYQRCRNLCVMYKCQYPEARKLKREHLLKWVDEEMKRYPEATR